MFKRVLPVLLLLCVSISIAFFNVQKGTWLIGWDSTQPELNFPLNISRDLSAMWQEYRGLGVTDGMAHSANLIHIVYTWTLSQIVGTAYVRYAFVLLAHLLGGVGMYALLQYLGRSIRGDKVGRWIALAGALFYMLNPYTLQMFYQPLELFVTHFAALPWLTFTLVQYVNRPNKRNLGRFALANILTLPQAHVPTLFIVWMMLAVCLLWPVLLLRTKRYGKQILIVILVSIGIHGFWGFPYAYSALNNAKYIGEAKINLLSNPEVLLRNDAYGDIASIVKMHGFSLAYEDWDTNQVYGLQMPEWVKWWDQDWVGWVMDGFFILAAIGLATLIAKRRWWTGGIILMYVVALGNLGARIPYVREIGIFLRVHVPYYEAIFRFTFTKFALVYAFVFTILMVMGMLGLYRLVRGWFSVALSVVVILGIVAVAWPVSQGRFFYHNLKLKVPGEYQSVYKFFDEHSEGRVLPLPYPDFWGWQSNGWGYRGSGFVWQGITNPTLYGAFNAWSPHNEGFYDEFSTALYGGKKEDVASVLTKYDVQYVLLDESVIAPGQDNKILRREETKEMARELGWQEKFHEGFLTVWDTGITTGNKFVSAPSKYTVVSADTEKVRKDVVWHEVGNYISANQRIGESATTYPFASLMREETKNVEYGDGAITVRSDLVGTSPTRSDLENRKLVVPGGSEGEKIELVYTAKLEKGKLLISWEPWYQVNGQEGPKLADQELSVNENIGVWVVIGESQPVWVPVGQGAIGQSSITVNQPIKINVYQGEGTQQVISDLWLDKNVQEKCGEGVVCISIPLAKPKIDSLVQTVQKYRGARPSVCIDREGDPYKCEDILTKLADPVITTIETRADEQDWLDISIKGSKADLMKNLEVPLVISFPVLKAEEIKVPDWGIFTNIKEFDLQGPTLKVEVNSMPRVYDLAVLGTSEVTNCDVLKRGNVGKAGNKYTAQERGAACDYAEMRGLSTGLPYLLRMQGEDIEGRSMKFFWYNSGSRRNDLEYLLNKGEFDQTFAVLPWQFDGAYTLNVETRSFGQPTENSLVPVEVRYFPLAQMTGMQIGPTGSDPVGEKSQLLINGVEKAGTWLYRVRTAGEGLLKLSQGYDRGWVGVANNKLLGHVKVNGWANGWMVPAGVDRVIIFYWPQLLEYLGFVIMGLTVTLIILHRK